MSKTVLIIEDDASVAEMLCDVLGSEGFDVLLEADGEWGLRTFESKPIDLLVVDVLIPKLQGFELIARVRKIPKGKTVPIVVISGVYRSQTYRDELVAKHGIRDFLDKPVDVDHLIDVLHDVFSSAYPEPKSSPSGSHRGPSLLAAPPASARPPEPMVEEPLADKGDLTDISFAALYGRLFRERATGALMVRKSSIKKIVYLKDGIPIFIKSNLLSECLGRIMVQERLISQEDCDASLERKKKTKKRQGDVLIEMGSISQHNLGFALELQMQTKLFDLFSWLEGRYQYSPDASYSGSPIVLPMAPAAIIYEGANRAMSTDRMARELAPVASCPITASDDPSLRYQTLQLEPRAARVLDQMDGSRTLSELIDGAEIEREDATLLLFALYTSGLVRALKPQERPIALEDGDVEILSTGEINAIAQLARVEPKAAPPTPPSEDRWKEPGPIMLPMDRVPDPLDGATEEAFSSISAPSIPTVPPEPPPERKAPKLSSLPRAPKWEPPRPVEEPSSVPALSNDVRQRVRARLEAEVAKIAEARSRQRPEEPRAADAGPVTRKFATRPSITSTYRVRSAQKDAEQDRKLEADLGERLEELAKLTYYELFEVATDASVEIVRTAYHVLARKHDPERVVKNSASREARKRAEQIYLLLTRALGTLTNPTAREEYDARIGIVEPVRAPLITAETVFEQGRAALERGDLPAATQLFTKAVELNPNEGAYIAYRAWCAYSVAPGDDAVRASALELLGKASERSPRTEEIWLFAGAIYRAAGQRDEAVRSYQRALACNADCVSALDALRALEPPSQKKGGLLSRLNLS